MHLVPLAARAVGWGQAPQPLAPGPRLQPHNRENPLIIDCHCHAGKGDGLTGPWNTAAPLRDFLRWSSESGIHRTNLFAAFHSDYARANRDVARIVAGNPTRFYGFAFIHPRRDAGRVMSMVTTAVRRYGFRRIKGHRFDARITRQVW